LLSAAPLAAGSKNDLLGVFEGDWQPNIMFTTGPSFLSSILRSLYALEALSWDQPSFYLASGTPRALTCNVVTAFVYLRHQDTRGVMGAWYGINTLLRLEIATGGRKIRLGVLGVMGISRLNLLAGKEETVSLVRVGPPCRNFHRLSGRDFRPSYHASSFRISFLCAADRIIGIGTYRIVKKLAKQKYT
jgi:hypothetical protein